MITVFQTPLKSYKEDYLIYIEAINIFPNSYLANGFAYLPHFFIFTPLILNHTIFLIVSVLVFFYIIYRFKFETKQDMLLFIMFGLPILYKGNIDMILCLFLLVPKGKIILCIKPQFILIFLSEKKQYIIILVIISIGIILSIGGFISIYNLIGSFFRPSIFLYFLSTKF